MTRAATVGARACAGFLGVGLGLGVVGCGGDEAPVAPLQKAASDLSLDGLEAPVSGTLAGEAFAADSAWYRVKRFPGRERVDLYFDSPAPERCGLPVRRETRRVWLRFPGKSALDPGELRAATDVHGKGDERPEGTALTVHYELGTRGHKWVGRSGGVVAVAIDEVEPRAISGRLNVCFDDGEQSCVAGAFRAPECFTRIDGRVFREGVGLLSGAAPPAPPPATLDDVGGEPTEEPAEDDPAADEPPEEPE